MDDTIKYIEKNKIGRFSKNVSMAKCTSYKSGGISKLMVFPKDLRSLIKLLTYLKEKKIKYKVLGNGSNTLFSDSVYDGVIIRLDCFDKVEFKKNKVICGSGAKLVYVANQACKKSLTGLEFASGIPGTIGGAVYMNAGAYKSDMGYIVESVKVITPNFEVIKLTNREMNFHYRTSFLQKHPNYICIEATLKLQNGDKTAIYDVMRDRKERRIASQPLEYPSCGSVFRNPEGMFAGKLIEDIGLKGYRIGGAMVSEKHANFIINYDNATSEDIHSLILYVKDEVKKHYDVDLKIEQEFVNWE
jgi:UDP-N-acetylmuramate dehydrogenase